MKKLKTLKELSYTYHKDRNGKKIYRDFVQVKEIKAEAVKWVKHKKGLDYFDWMEFFNLTEEDLK